MTNTRICTDCGEEKELGLLVKNRKCLYGRRALCKKCNVIRVQNEYDPVKKSVYDKSRRKEKLEELRGYDRLRAKQPHRKAAKAEWSRKRKAILKEATPEDYDREGVLSIYTLAQKLSLVTGVLIHVDHITPLASGGKHNTNNLRLLEASLNIAKSDKEDWKSPLQRLTESK